MKKTIAVFAIGAFMLPSLTFASSGISHSQAEALLLVLVAFGVDQPIIDNVRAILEPVSAPSGTTTAPHLPQFQIPWPVFVPHPAPAPVVPPAPVPGNTATSTPEPVVVLPPVDTKPPVLNNLFSIDYAAQRSKPADIDAAAGYYLRLISNEPLDLEATVLPQGMSLGEAVYSGLSAAHDVVKFPGNNTPQRYYYYEVPISLNGTTGPVVVTVKDLAGNGVTRTLIVQ